METSDWPKVPIPPWNFSLQFWNEGRRVSRSWSKGRLSGQPLPKAKRANSKLFQTIIYIAVELDCRNQNGVFYNIFIGEQTRLQSFKSIAEDSRNILEALVIQSDINFNTGPIRVK
ncbi:uncharacterized protein [Palaemon carinicauda]|uniref:uncharacterized protein isoform X2 n=1 Tax=Palaemon carinicauda TaxID=392227 RepID=UPI0035B6122A